jgi:hypothetical protein
MCTGKYSRKNRLKTRSGYSISEGMGLINKGKGVPKGAPPFL